MQDRKQKGQNENSSTQVTQIFNSALTAKPVLAIKAVAKDPDFWAKSGRGSRTKPLTNGDYAKTLLLSEELEKVQLRPDVDKILAVPIRERWINKVYHKCIKEDGYKQVLILGSGYDLSALKKNAANQFGKKNASLYSRVRFWEVDRPAILDDKEKIFREQGWDKNAIYVKADYVKDNFIEMLEREKIDFDAPTIIIWEGNWMYLENDEVEKTLHDLKAAFNNFVLIFDYCSQALLDKVSATRSIWKDKKLGLEDIEQFAKDHGFSVIDNQTTANLAKEYDVDNNPPEEFSQYSICSLRRA